MARATPPVGRGKAAARDKTMDMRMEQQGLCQGMKRFNDAWRNAKILWVTEKIEEGVPHGCEEKIGHQPDVQKPQVIEFMRHGEDHEVMVTTEQTRACCLISHLSI